MCLVRLLFPTLLSTYMYSSGAPAIKVFSFDNILHVIFSDHLCVLNTYLELNSTFKRKAMMTASTSKGTIQTYVATMYIATILYSCKHM